MKKVILAVLAAVVLTACNSNKQTTDKDMTQTLQLTQEWDKVFPLSEKVNHKKVTFETQYGLTLAFDPSYTGESSGEPRRTASPDINTEDFMAAVDFLSKQENVDADKIGVIGICGWGGIALNAAAADTRIKATVASTMYDMTRCPTTRPNS